MGITGRERGKEEGMDGRKEKRKVGRKERKKEGPGILVRVGAEGSLGLGRANIYMIQTKHK